MDERKAIIIGAGPAGLTAAYELQQKTDIKPVIFEMSQDIGGIAKTVNYKGNRIDIGGHRFFSKSDRVMSWWRQFLPLQGAPSRDEREVQISYQNKQRGLTLNEDGPDPEKEDRVMLVRNRLSRIFFLRKFFEYPISLSVQTMKNLGLVRLIRIGFSIIKSKLFPVRPEKSLEDFLINRFGRELYRTFFKDYTEKVWGVPCDQISAEWGAQRIKGLSLTKAIWHAMRGVIKRDTSVDQKKTETTLIERFLYPKLGPGQLWEYVAELVQQRGAELHMEQAVVGLKVHGNRVVEITTRDQKTQETRTRQADYFFSTMPVKDLLRAMGDAVPANVREVGEGLIYRDFITVGLLLNKLKIRNQTDRPTPNNIVPDNWIYIQERDVRVGRLQIFNNWSPYMIKDPDKVWLGLEYFCNEGDDLWSMNDAAFAQFAIDELAKIDIIEQQDVLDHVVIRMPKTYPAYFGSYERFDVIRNFTDSIENLFLVGRNGMHRYNNQDHSMLAAMTAVENIAAGRTDKTNIWDVNTEQEYHEEKEEEASERQSETLEVSSQKREAI
jgi:protoporphyrinogen oxidase